MVKEFNYLKATASEPLHTFLEYISFEYMIENVMLLLKGTLSGRNVNELIEQCQPLETAFVMAGLLEARADRMAINITLNSFGTMLNEPSMRESERKKLYPGIGMLYPEGSLELADAAYEASL